MKKLLGPHFSKSVLALASFVLGAAQLSAQTTLYFDQNGPTIGAGLVDGGSYEWNLSDAVWNTNATGGEGTFSAWDNASDDIAFIRQNVGSGRTITINLAQPIRVGGVRTDLSANYVFQASAAASVTLGGGAEIRVQGNDVDGFTFGNNVNLMSDFTIIGAGGNVRINGTGDAYSGQITINNTGTSIGGFYIDAGSRIGVQTRMKINQGVLRVAAGTSKIIGELSGAGGAISPVGGATLTVNQTTNTEFGGRIGANAGNGHLNLVKEGSGRLSLTATGTHYAVGAAYSVNAGSLYIAGMIDRVGNSNFNINVADEALLGGTLHTNKRVLLSSAGGIIAPGMHGEAGVMNLDFDLRADHGATFHFNMNGADEGGDLLNSMLIMKDGELRLSGNKLVKFFDLGENLIEEGVAYTLLDATSTTLTRVTGWDLNWSYDVGTTGWVVQNFGIQNNQLQVVFSSVPEPSSLFLLGATSAGVLLLRRRNTSARR